MSKTIMEILHKRKIEICHYKRKKQWTFSKPECTISGDTPIFHGMTLYLSGAVHQ